MFAYARWWSVVAVVAVVAPMWEGRGWGGIVTTEAFVGTTMPSLGSTTFVPNKGGGIVPTMTRASRRKRSMTTGGLNMMFEQLSSAITDIAQNLGGRKKITEKGIQTALRDVRRALLDADVNIGVADTLIEGVKKRAVGTEVTKGVTADQQFVKAMYDELLDMMGGDASVTASAAPRMKPSSTLARGNPEEPAVVLLAGLQGAGKTTAAGKLALYLKEREVDYDLTDGEEILASRMPTTNRTVLLVAADVYRPAAIQQLEVLGETIGVEVYSKGTDADPVDIAGEALAYAKEKGFDTVVVDTAGRQIVDVELMDELRRIKELVEPAETLLVVDAMTGQEAASLTASFDGAVGITGAILTKMDGDSRGGAAVSVRGVSGQPIKFVGVGEKVADLEPFYPERMASRILGMGDVVSLVEKAAAQVSDEEAAAMQQKMLEARFDFNDFQKQSKLLANMGNLAGVAKMMPGMAGQLSGSKMAEAQARLKKNGAMINSMTAKERADPDLLLRDRSAQSRLQRIARGSGLQLEDGQLFMSEFQRMRTMMSRMQKQMGMGGMGGDEDADPSMEPAPMGNRNQRRAQKKAKKGKRVAPRGFG